MARSYLNVSQDATRGVAQKKEKFWGRIAAYYNEHRPQGSPSRPQRSLESKWGIVKQDVAKFIGLHAQVVALNTSGTLEDDVLGETLELWKQKDKNGRGFAYLHCWAILWYISRWMEIREESRRMILVRGS